MLFVIDGAKALRKAIRSVFGEVPVQRCIRHKERNVLEHLPERDRPVVKARLRRAWAETDHDRALDQLRQLATELARTHPGAFGSLREGMEETLTLTRLAIKGSLKRTLVSTNPCESMIATSSSLVALDRLGISLACLIRIEPCVSAGPALPHQIPKPIQLDTDLLEALMLPRAEAGIGFPTGVQQPVLLGDELLDVI